MGHIRHDENFKRDAVRYCRLHGSIIWVADLLGVQPNTLRKWLLEYGEEIDTLQADEGRSFSQS